MEVKFLKLAQAEFDDAVTFYESEQPGLGKRFRGEVLRSVSRIIGHHVNRKHNNSRHSGRLRRRCAMR